MSRKYVTLVSGIQTVGTAVNQSTGVADADKVIGTGADGKLDISLLPTGVGPATVVVPASEALSAGDFVNFHDNGGVLNARLADATNARAAGGFVIAAVNAGANATVYRFGQTNAGLAGLVVGNRYFLGTNGDVTNVPYDINNPANAGYISQFIGIAKTATELLTEFQPATVI